MVGGRDGERSRAAGRRGSRISGCGEYGRGVAARGEAACGEAPGRRAQETSSSVARAHALVLRVLNACASGDDHSGHAFEGVEPREFPRTKQDFLFAIRIFTHAGMANVGRVLHEAIMLDADGYTHGYAQLHHAGRHATVFDAGRSCSMNHRGLRGRKPCRTFPSSSRSTRHCQARLCVRMSPGPS